MTNLNAPILLSDLKDKNLAQWSAIDPQATGLSIQYNAQQSSFQLKVNDTPNEQTSLAMANIELVVFSDINMATFAALLSECDISELQLNAINKRNNLTSYRFFVKVNNLKRARERLVSYATKQQIEVALLKNAPKLNQPGLLMMDMDSTTIEIECIDEIAALAGVGEEIAAVTELAMQGQLDFSESLHQRVGKLANAPEKILADVAKNLPLMTGLESLVSALKEHQWRVAIASGGFTYFADHLAEILQLDAAFANVLEIENNTLTGKVLGEVIDAQAKAECLTQLQSEYNIASTQTVAMGDGANDLVMMAAAHLGIAFHAKPLVLAQADSCITHSGLDCMLHWLA